MSARLRRPAVIAIALLAAAAGLAGCASAKSRSDAEPAVATDAEASAAVASPERPLATIAAQRIVVAPLQRLSGADVVGWTEAIGAEADYRRLVDDEIAFALRERQVGADWVFPAALAASARRNAPVAADPYALDVAPLLAGPPRSGGPVELVEPLAGQVRSLVAFSDARFVLVPTELHFERRPPAAGGAARAVLRVAVVDARLSRVRWAGEVASDTTSAFSPAIAAGVAARLADLVAKLP